MAQTAREASLARRIALSTSGKAAISGSADRTRMTPGSAAKAATPAPATSSQGGSARDAALARRIAMSKGGKGAVASADRTRTASANASASTVTATTPAPAASYTSAPATSSQGNSARNAALARRIAMSKGGKGAVANTDRTRTASANASAATENSSTAEGNGCGCGCGGKKAEAAPVVDTSTVDTTPAMSAQVTANLVKKVAQNPARAAALSRRKAMSTKGKSALKGGTVSEASAARAANPNLSSRELAQALREQRSTKGKTDKKQTSTVATGPGRHRKAQDAAEDAPWKVGASDTASGQTVTGTMVDRTNDVTGNEASTCRSVTGTEYMGADVFQDFCQADATPAFNRVSVTSTGSGNPVSGNRVGRSGKVTGDESGTCKNVTGDEYVSAEQSQSFCGSFATAAPEKFSIAETMKGKKVSGDNAGRSDRVTGNESGSDRSLTGTQYMMPGEDTAPEKVNVSQTLRGGSVTGQHIGRSENVTGDETGSCRNVTGDDYVGAEQYSDFCKSTPAPSDRKVGISNTLMGKSVSGTMTDRSDKVTGSEAGTCKALTGTPYTGEEQTEAFCSSADKSLAMARSRKGTTNVGPGMTGIQPGLNGVMTGAEKGVCEPVTGTPYVGADQAAGACPASAATPASPDFPQALGAGQPWGDFSVTSPSGEAQDMMGNGAVTGATYEKGQITGPFGMAGGKVTGTEEARFGGAKAPMPEPVPAAAETVDGRVKSRISGEGQNAGQKITGDDWDRGDHVTGTEGTSATRRNPTRRGPVASMAVDNKRNEEVAVPVSKVTGSSGNTGQGSLITYSGGARG
ncbi:MAG: carboxysome shell protein [Gammaproteobacteria bacterium]|nr:carboxysome shell protein [Gammaproteobacteria bacterium]